MQPKTEELLYFLMWSAETLLNPSFRNVTGSFESWAYRNGLLRQLSNLEKRRLLECRSERPDERIVRLTEPGRLRALGGRDPAAQWARYWDGRWRLVLFDVPAGQNTRRNQLRSYLRGRGFGYLQNSVWITPDPLQSEREILRGSESNVESLLLMEGRPCAGETDAEVVAGAWDFDALNRAYRRHQDVLEQRPTESLRDEKAARRMQQWAAVERAAWLRAVSRDPLLPEVLLPRAYLGQVTWKLRVKVLAQARRQWREFQNFDGA